MAIHKMDKQKITECFKPFSIEEIQPSIVFYQTNCRHFKMEYDSDPKEVADKLNEKGFLDVENLIIITHGYLSNSETEWLANYKNVILSESSCWKTNQTVAILDWGKGAIVYFYWQAVVNLAVVGKWLAPYIQSIKEVKPETYIYGIGHSLGAHLLGVAGRESRQFDRITGLDPAGFLFENVEDSDSLKADDAEFVDVIHTDGYDTIGDESQQCFPFFHFGSLEPMGTLDFYPNFGYDQPGADSLTSSHLRVLDLFEWSITNRGKFVTNLVLDGTPHQNHPVDSYVSTETLAEMGFFANKRKLPPEDSSTFYYIKTNSEEPWAPAEEE